MATAVRTGLFSLQLAAPGPLTPAQAALQRHDNLPADQ